MRGVNLRRWLTPGIGIKRWLLVTFAGLLLLALAGAHVVRQATRDVQPGGVAQIVIDALTLQFLPYALRGLLVGLLGGLLVVLGAVRVIRAFTEPFRPAAGADADQPLVEVIYQKRFLARGPRIVAIGGGTGLSTLLRGLKEHSSNITAVVTVADDGGSSGVLREELGIPPVGDIRNCIVALADAESLMAGLLQYRFPAGEGRGELPRDGRGLEGHAVGNLLIAAMSALEGGDFEEGVRRMNRVLAVRGQVVPVSPTPLTLHARLRDGRTVDGQSLIGRSSGIDEVWISPADVAASADALTAIAEADLIVLGPGSLYTSLLPALLVPQVREAVLESPALTVFVCNVATQPGETAGYDLAAHVEALVGHTEPGIADLVLANSAFGLPVPAAYPAEPVRLSPWPPIVPTPPGLALDEVVDPTRPHHHHPALLAVALLRLLEQEGGRRSSATRPGIARPASSA